MKGQTSFEMLFVLLIIISAAVLINGLYLQGHDDTIALEIARNELSAQANLSEKNFTIGNVGLETTPGGTTLFVTTFPEKATNSDFNLDAAEQKIAQATKYKNIQIQIN